jgi:RHH-type rel operon transcriptional repressor/antitoxin RelB
MLAVRLDKKMESRINKLAKITGRTKSYYIREAVEKHLDELEDLYIALYRLEHPEKTVSLKDMIKEHKKA